MMVNGSNQLRLDFCRRETIQLSDLREGLRRQVQSTRPHSDSFQSETVHLPTLWQSLRPQVLPLQARGVLLYENGSQNQSGLVPNSSFSSLLYMIFYQFCRI